MPTDPGADQTIETMPPAEAGADRALEMLTDPSLDPLFRAQPRTGALSAWHAHVPFAQWLVAAMRPATIVELGTHNGVSYAAFCEAVQQGRMATRCYAVDSWLGDDHAGHYGESVYADLRAFHDGRYGAFSELLRMTFDEAREVIADGSVDLLHIDGFHSYDAVRHDFDGWLPKLSHRAVVLFHDTNVLERGFGVARLWAEVAGRFPSFSFLHGHGLGVLAVGGEVHPAVARLCAAGTPGGAALLRERFAALGRIHGQDHALRETARREQQLRGEAAERDAVVETLRRSLAEVLSHRDSLLAAEAAARIIPEHETTIAGLRQALHEGAASLDEARLRATRAEAATEEGAGRVRDAQAEAAADRAALGRLRDEMDALRGHLAAARSDARAARGDRAAEAARLQAEIDGREAELDRLRAAAAATTRAAREAPLFLGLRPRRH